MTELILFVKDTETCVRLLSFIDRNIGSIMSREFVITIIDGETDVDTVEDYDIKSIPTILIGETTQIVGVKNIRALLRGKHNPNSSNSSFNPLGKSADPLDNIDINSPEMDIREYMTNLKDCDEKDDESSSMLRDLAEHQKKDPNKLVKPKSKNDEIHGFED